MAAGGAFEKLSVILEARTRKYVRDVSKAADATDDWADETEKAGARQEAAARKSEGSLSRVVRSIRKTRSEAKKPATFSVEAEERGFDGPRGAFATMKAARADAAKGADFELRGDNKNLVAAVYHGKREVMDLKKWAMTGNGTVGIRGDNSDLLRSVAASKAAVSSLPDKKTVNMDLDAGGVLSQLALVNRATDGVVDGFNLSVKTARNAFTAAIPAAVATGIAALQPLMGAGGAGGSAVASVGAGFGLIGLAARQTFDKIEVENGRFVAKTDATLTASQQKLVDHLNRAGSTYASSFRSANNASNRFMGDVVQTAERTFPYFGRLAERSTVRVSGAFADMRKELSKPDQLDSFRRLLNSAPGMAERLTRSAGNFFGGAANYFSEATPHAKDLSRWVERTSEDFLGWSRSKEGRAQMREDLQAGARFAGNLAEGVGDVFTGLMDISRNKSAQAALNGLVSGTGKLVKNTGKLADEGLDVLTDIFDLKAPKPVGWGAAGKTAGVSFVSKYNAELRASAANQAGEGSPSYELGFKAGKSTTSGAIAAIRANGGGVKGAIKAFLTPGDKDAGGPTSWGSEAGRGFRQAMVAEIGKTNWGKAAFKGQKDIKRQGGIAGTQVGQSYRDGIIPRIRRAHSQWYQDTARTGERVVGNTGSTWSSVANEVGRGSSEARRRGTENSWDLRRQIGRAWGAVKSDSDSSWSSMANKVGAKSAEAKAKGTSNSWDLRRQIGRAWDSLRSDNDSSWTSLANKVGAKTTEAKTKGTKNSWDLKRQAISAFEALSNSSLPIFSDLASAIIRKSWDAERGSTNAWSSLSSFVSNVLSKLGIGGGSSGGAGSPPKNSGQQRQTNFARGGVFRADRGGVAGPGHVGLVGEAGQNEAIVNLERKTPESQAAFRAAAKSPNASSSQEGSATAAARTHRTASRRGAGHPMAKGRQEGFGPATYTLVEPLKKVADTIAARYNTPWNSYENHPPNQPMSNQPYWRERSVDWWGSGGRGDPIGSIWTKVAADAKKMLGSNLEYMLDPNNDPAGHWDHVHVSAFIGQDNLKTATGSGPAGGGTSGPSWQEMLYNKIWPPVENWAKSKFDPMLANPFWAAKAGGGLGQQTITNIGDWIYEQIPKGGGSITGGNSPSGLTIGEALSQGGWPENLLVPASSTVWHESGGKADARNPNSTATGLMQILHSTAQGVGADPNKLTDPIYNTATGYKVYQQAGGFSPWVAAGRGGDYRDRPVTGYAKGGVTGRGGTKLEMPSRVGSAFALVADTLRSLAGRRGTGGMLVADEGGVGDGSRIAAITNEAGPEGVMPLRKWTPGGQQAFDAGRKIYGKRSHRTGHTPAGVTMMAAGGTLGVQGGKLSGGHGPNGVGRDVWAPPGTTVSAPWPMEVTSMKDMGGSYGIQQWGYLTSGGKTYTFVMGHLGSGSGQGKYRAGAPLGTIGNLPGIDPHVHWAVGTGAMPPPGTVDPTTLAASSPGMGHDETAPASGGSAGGLSGRGGSSSGSGMTITQTQAGPGPQRSFRYQSSGSSGSSGAMQEAVEGWGRRRASGAAAGLDASSALDVLDHGEIKRLREVNERMERQLRKLAGEIGDEVGGRLMGKPGENMHKKHRKNISDRLEAAGVMG